MNFRIKHSCPKTNIEAKQNSEKQSSSNDQKKNQKTNEKLTWAQYYRQQIITKILHIKYS